MPVGPRNGVKTLSQPSSSSISAPSSVDEMKASAYVAVLQTYLSQKRVGAEVESERKAGRTLEASRQARRRRSARGRSGRRTRRARRARSSWRQYGPVAQVCGVRRAARKAKEDEERERTHDRPQHALELDDVRALERRLLVHVHHVDEVVHALAVAQDVAALGGPSELAEKVRWRGAVEARPVRRRGVSSRRRRCSERDEDARRALHAAVCFERRSESELELDHVDEVALLRARCGEGQLPPALRGRRSSRRTWYHVSSSRSTQPISWRYPTPAESAKKSMRSGSPSSAGRTSRAGVSATTARRTS